MALKKRNALSKAPAMADHRGTNSQRPRNGYFDGRTACMRANCRMAHLKCWNPKADSLNILAKPRIPFGVTSKGEKSRCRKSVCIASPFCIQETRSSAYNLAKHKAYRAPYGSPGGKDTQNTKSGLVQLMHKKHMQDITARELTELCHLSRGTFYCHYKEVYNMVYQVEDELIEKLRQLSLTFSPRSIFEHPDQFFMELFLLIQDDEELISVLIGPNGDLRFIV